MSSFSIYIQFDELTKDYHLPNLKTNKIITELRLIKLPMAALELLQGKAFK